MQKVLHLLGILEDVDIDWIANHGRPLTVSPGTVLIQEHQPVTSLYIVLDGELRVVTGGVHGTPVATLRAGEVVGEVSLVSAQDPSATVVASAPTRLLALSRDLLLSKLRQDQGFAMRFYHSIASFLATRLHVTVGRYGYGSAAQDADPDELPQAALQEVDLAALRFDKLQQRFRNTRWIRSVQAV